jgi:hypothetical protein
MIFHTIGGSVFLLFAVFGVWQAMRARNVLKAMSGTGVMFLLKQSSAVLNITIISVWVSVMGIVGLAHIYAGLCGCTWTIDPIYEVVRQIVRHIEVNS